MILVQRRNDEFPTERNRVAVPMFTANRTAEMGGFLTQNHGTSRYGTIEVEKIDKRYSQRVKVDQMWAEALMLYETQSLIHSTAMNTFRSCRSTIKDTLSRQTKRSM